MLLTSDSCSGRDDCCDGGTRHAGCRQADRMIERGGGEGERDRDMQTDRLTGRQAEEERVGLRHRQTDREKEREREREAG